MCQMKFIGFYDYTVVLTYLSLVSSVWGMTRAIHGDYKLAIFCLAFSGICDAFDGIVARTKKNRTQDEKNFGIQLDSLCDMFCFGVFPAMICYLLGVRGALGVALVLFYCLCAVIRLAFFNVLEGKRQLHEGGVNKSYRGLPVTSIAFILPLTFWLQFVLPELAFFVLLHAVLLVVGFLFILDFRMPKLGLKAIIGLSAILLFTVGVIFAYTRFRVPAPTEETNPIIEEIEELVDMAEEEYAQAP
nr:CDP-alcohol phosphatidyltransferase family protein [Clostridia bacterium]